MAVALTAPLLLIIALGIAVLVHRWRRAKRERLERKDHMDARQADRQAAQRFLVDPGQPRLRMGDIPWRQRAREEREALEAARRTQPYYSGRKPGDPDQANPLGYNPDDVAGALRTSASQCNADASQPDPGRARSSDTGAPP